MSQARYYSPRVRRDLVSKLYWQAQSLEIPMTKLINRIVAEGLSRYRVRDLDKTRAEGRDEQLMFNV
jgi:hypothetical protein